MSTFLANLWNDIATFFGSINIFTSLLDIVLVAFVVYSLIKLVRDSRAEQLIKGIFLLLIVYVLSSWLQLKALHYLLALLMTNGLILLAVIFQPEIRRALEHAGHSRLTGALRIFGRSESEELIQQWRTAIKAVCSACETLQKQRMGALIVLERNTRLGEIVNSGTTMNADPSPELIGNVFFNKAPLHDGAMILREGRVCAAGCILPLTGNPQLSPDLGTRHRAAIGMSENSDALVVVVSEETGTISLAMGGRLTRNFTPTTLRVELENGMFSDMDGGDDDNLLRRLKRRWRSS